MKKTWILIALSAALCAACADGESKCVTDGVTCKTDGTSSILVTCQDGIEQEEVCKSGYTCDASKAKCVVAAVCSNDMKPNCDQANSRIVYCSNNAYAYTDCPYGCGVNAENNAVCNKSSGSEAECSAGAVRCNLSGEREICDAAGKWQANPCCADASTCALKCVSGKCESLYAEGETRCASDTTYQKFTNGVWSAAQSCPASAPLCSKGSCTTPEWSYCGTETVTLSNGTSVVFDTFCAQAYGTGYIGVCHEGEPYDCAAPCAAANAGKTENACDTFTLTSGNEADFAFEQKCTDLSDGTHYAYIMDEDTEKACKNACNTGKTDCDSQGYASGTSTDTPSENADPYFYCGTQYLDQNKTTTIADECGTGKVGLCFQDTDGKYYYDCFDACTEAEAQAGTKKGTCGKETIENQDYSITTNLACKSYDGNYAYGPFGTFTVCNGSCAADAASCDTQGGKEYGQEYSSGGSSSGGSSSDSSLFLCGDYTYNNQKISAYCESELPGSIGVCQKTTDGTGFGCFETCNKENNTSKVCREYTDGYYLDTDICMSVEGTLVSYPTDEYEACANGCNTSGTACK